MEDLHAMPSQKYDFYIEQGTTWTRQLVCKDGADEVVDLSNYTARMQIRASTKSTAVLISLTTENGRITIDGPNGSITLLVIPTDTTPLEVTRGVYDIEIIDPTGNVWRIMQGTVYFDPEVTR